MRSRESDVADIDAIQVNGSIAYVLEYLRYAINGILFHRGVYPAEDFYVEKRFGLDLLLTINTSVDDYIELTLRRMRDWLVEGSVSHMAVVLMDADDGHVVERWVFEMHIIESSSATPRDDLQMDREMNAVMKDIISPTYLPTIENPTVFNILVYAHESTSIPEGWDKTHLHGIEEGENDTLKALTARRHTVSLSVAYRDEE